MTSRYATRAGNAPLVDRVELTLISAANCDGTLDPAAMATISESHLTELVEWVRAANPAVSLGVLVPCSVGDDRTTRNVCRDHGGLLQRQVLR